MATLLKEDMKEIKLDIFKHNTNLQHFFAGDVIFRKGDTGDEMYVVQEGKVEIWLENELLQTIEPKDIFGEMVLVDQNVRSATAIASTDCKLLPVSKSQFNFMVQMTPYFAIWVMTILARRLKATNQLLTAR